MKNIIEINIQKIAEDLNATDKVLCAPRSWSPEALKEACNNLCLESHPEILPLETAVIEFLIKEFFFIQHQTGLYNLQKKLWGSLAKARKVRIERSSSNLFEGKNKYFISDILLLDIGTHRFVKARIVHPNPEIEFPTFNRLTSMIPNKCSGILYFVNQDYTNEFMEKVLSKTNSKDLIDKYKSPITKDCSLNLIKYTINEPNTDFGFELIHPNLGRKIGARIRLEYQTV